MKGIYSTIFILATVLVALPNGALSQSDDEDEPLSMERRDCDSVSYQLEASVPKTSAADVLFIVDESDNMSRAQTWMKTLVTTLDVKLRESGIGTKESNKYGVVGFPGILGPRSLTSSCKVGNSESIAECATLAMDDLRTNPFNKVQDGYEAIEYALRNGQLRRNTNVSRVVVLITDQDRRIADPKLKRGSVKRLVRRNGVKLSVIVSNQFGGQDSGSAVIGVNADPKKGYAISNGKYTAVTGSKILKGHGQTRKDYTTLALGLGGAAWNIEFLEGGSDDEVELFKQAFIDDVVNMAYGQVVECQECDCDGTCTTSPNKGQCKCLRKGGKYQKNGVCQLTKKKTA